jgi:hypothetical protein
MRFRHRALKTTMPIFKSSCWPKTPGAI